MYAVQTQPLRFTPVSTSPSADPRRILLVGDPDLREQARPWLAELDAEINFLPWGSEIESQVDDDLVGVVLLGHPPEATPWAFVRTLTGMLDRQPPAQPVPVAALLDGEMDDEKARRVYEHGATAVIRLDATEADLGVDDVGRLLPRSFAAYLARGPVRATDRALARQARIRLGLASPRFSRLDIHVDGGRAQVIGGVRALLGRRTVQQVVESVPGIVKADTSAVRITSRATDTLLGRRVDDAIERAVDDPEELQTRVEDGRVVVAGSVTSRDELRRLGRAIRACPGARALENYAVIEPA